MQDLEVLENKKTCRYCLHFVNDGDRCDKINNLVYSESYGCGQFERMNKICGECQHFVERENGNICTVNLGSCHKGAEACDNYIERSDVNEGV